MTPEIVWTKIPAQDGDKVVEVDQALNRFILFPTRGSFGKMINMWSLWDQQTGSQWFVMKEKADQRIKDILEEETNDNSSRRSGRSNKSGDKKVRRKSRTG